MTSRLLWSPDSKTIIDSNLAKFISHINERYSTSISGYFQLYEWSITNTEEFWSLFWDFSKVVHSKSYDKVIANKNTFSGTEWFPGSSLNFAENLLRFRDDQIAIKFRGECREDYDGYFLTYSQLYTRVAQVASSLRKIGLQSGDVIVAYMPNIPETIIALLATASIGALWASCGSELGPSAVIDRLGQVTPKVLFTVDGYFYKGIKFSILDNIRKISDEIPSLEKIVIFPFMEINTNITSLEKAVSWDKFKDHTANSVHFEQSSFNHPLYIMFSSGTTGKPKSMVQSGGGVLINHLKELILHTDLKRSDIICYITSPSWMMWNWLVSSLAVGATILLYNGNPTYPDWKTIWKIIEDEKISIFGTSASYIHYLMKLKTSPRDEFNLTSLREISQTASPLSAEGFEFVYSSIKKDLHFNSISGGTDINGCFAAGSPIIPVYAGQIQSPALAMAIKAYNESGNHVVDVQGELVCESPSPSMPLYFWNDDKFEKYKKAYFNHYTHLGKNVWRHGDYIVFHGNTGGITFHGRSDAVLKPSGVRIGTAEIYNIVESISEIEDSVVIGQNWQGDQRIILFVKLKDKMELTSELESKIKTALREDGSPRHVPHLIVKTPAIPYTFSNKKVEIAITEIAHGRQVTNKGALANPDSLDYYESFFANVRN